MQFTVMSLLVDSCIMFASLVSMLPYVLPYDWKLAEVTAVHKKARKLTGVITDQLV